MSPGSSETSSSSPTQSAARSTSSPSSTYVQAMTTRVNTSFSLHKCHYMPFNLTSTQELHPSFATFPTYATIIPFKGTSQDVVDFYAKSAATPIPDVPKFDSRRVVDGERRVTFLAPIPTSSEGTGNFQIRNKVLGVYDKGKPGSVVDTEQTLVDKKGTVYSKVKSSSFFVGQGGWGGAEGGEGAVVRSAEGEECGCGG
ncbi:hypothetical protein MRB53_041351 [Persea americana]|nr:hypothetical protein MRB53_041351 [Persea americana]